MFLAVLLGVMLVGALCSALLGANWGVAAMMALLAIGTVILGSLGGEGAILMLAYGGGFVLIAAGIGIAIGTAFRKKEQ